MFLWHQTRESPGPGLLWHSPPGCRGMSTSNWHTATQHGEVGWRNGTKSPRPTVDLLTIRSPVVLQNLIFRVELVPLMSWYGHKWETGFDRIHLQIILVHWSIFTEKWSVQPLHVRSRGDWTSWLSAEEVSLSVQVPGTELHCSHLSTPAAPCASSVSTPWHTPHQFTL